MHSENTARFQELKDQSTDMRRFIQTKFAKCMENLRHQQSGSSSTKTDVNMVHNSKKSHAFSAMPTVESTGYIIDSRANSHVCCNLYKLDKSIVIYLPDGTSTSVAFAGKAILTKENFLLDVLYVSWFTHNLLSVVQLIQNMGLKCVFYPTHCIFQK